MYAPGTAGPAVDTAPGLKLRAELTGEAAPLLAANGGELAGQLRIEGVKWGWSVDGRTLSVGADDGSGETDRLHFVSSFVTYSLLGNERSRLRVELGANAAWAPDLTVVSPAAGLSFAMGFGNGWGIEAVARGSAIPHTQLELAAGLSYGLGPLGLRAGWRRMYLNDNGLVDGVSHDDVFSGPYFGLGMAF